MTQQKQTKKSPAPSSTPEAVGAIAAACAASAAICQRSDAERGLFSGMLRAVAVGKAVRKLTTARYENAAFAFLRGKATHRAVKSYDIISRELQVSAAMSWTHNGIDLKQQSRGRIRFTCCLFDHSRNMRWSAQDATQS